jgi:hypothetical protein
VARLLDLKEKKEAARFTLAEQDVKANPLGGNPVPPDWGRAYAFFTSKGEPRVLFDGKLIDGTNGKVMQTFDPGAGLILSRDGKYLVRLTRKKDDKPMGVELWGLDEDK